MPSRGHPERVQQTVARRDAWVDLATTAVAQGQARNMARHSQAVIAGDTNVAGDPDDGDYPSFWKPDYDAVGSKPLAP